MPFNHSKINDSLPETVQPDASSSRASAGDTKKGVSKVYREKNLVQDVERFYRRKPVTIQKLFVTRF
jgi:hypothetical protein